MPKDFYPGCDDQPPAPAAPAAPPPVAEGESVKPKEEKDDDRSGSGCARTKANLA